MLRTTLQKLLAGCLLLSIFLLQGCRSGSQNPLLAEWYFTNEDFTSLSSPSEDKVLRLYPKGVYTLFGTFSYSIGKWRYNDKGKYIYLHQDNGIQPQNEIYLKVEQLQDKRLTAMLQYKTLSFQDSHSRLCHLRSQQNKSKYDPYSPEANRWRQPPDQSESDAAIRQRVTGYLQFLKALYQHALDNDMEALDEGWYPKPILMSYSNGVRMAYSNELDDWNQCFYDSAQAVKGYQFISGQVYDLHIKTGVNRFERNLDCVEQLLKSLPNPSNGGAIEGPTNLPKGEAIK